MIQEHPYFQYFCGYPGCDDSRLPFDPSLMVCFYKRLTPEILGEINKMILSAARKGEPSHDDRSRKKTVKKIRKAIGKQLRDLARNLASIDEKLTLGRTPSLRKTDRLTAIRTLDAYNEAGNLPAMAERFWEREGHYPSRILADKIYRNRENLRLCKEHGIPLSGPALGRPKKDEIRNKTRDFLGECERVEVERRFSPAKRKCGLGLIMTKLRQTIAHSVAMSILVLNLRKIQCALLRIIPVFISLMRPQENPMFVQ